MPVANDMFQARVVSIDKGDDGTVTATVGWLEGTAIEAGEIVAVMTLARFDALTKTAKSLLGI